jgi:hypothetical protein
MSKLVPSALLDDIRVSVGTLTCLIRIRREDGLTYHITNHDTDIVFRGDVYDHSIPFTLSAISTTSQMSVDNADLSLYMDGVTFKADEFENGAFGHAEIEIFLVDYTNPDHGRMILRQGWIGPIEVKKNGVAQITIFGLLKVLDFEVGRVYQPSCDADFGDKRCKIAVDFSQQRDRRVPYHVGDWVYTFNTSAANAVTVINHSFEDSSPVVVGDPIPGWTPSQPDASFTTYDGSFVDPGMPPHGPPTDGSYVLGAGSDTISPPAEQTIYQDFDLRETGAIELTGVPVEDDEVTVSDGTIIATFTFTASPALPGDILIGADAEETAASLYQAILDSNLSVEASISTATITIKNNLANGEIAEVVDDGSVITVTDFAGAYGINPADVDLGVIFWAAFVDWAQTEYFLDPPAIRAEVMDIDGNIIDVIDTGYTYLNELGAAVDDWRTGSVVFPVLGGARKIRLHLCQFKSDGTFFNSVFDNVRAYWWDHSLGDPWGGCIQKVARIVIWDAHHQVLPVNPSFETGAVANSNVNAITGWTRPSSDDWWQVVNQFFTTPGATDGVCFLRGGDDGSATQKTYSLYQDRTLAQLNLDEARVDLGKYIGRIAWSGLWTNDDSAISVALDFYDEDNVLLNTSLALDFTTAPAAAPTTANYVRNFAVPMGTRKIRLNLYARSPVGDSRANCGFDNFRFYFVDPDRPQASDPTSAVGSANTVFSNTPETYTTDGNLIWKAWTHYADFDVVNSVISRKEFIGTSITGADSTYSTSLIRWISGANKGARNIIRVFDGDTQKVKLYFKCLHPIQPGDRYMYVQACQKRFTEDCVLNFDNGLNFRGFPHLPGRLSD